MTLEEKPDCVKTANVTHVVVIENIKDSPVVDEYSLVIFSPLNCGNSEYCSLKNIIDIIDL